MANLRCLVVIFVVLIMGTSAAILKMTDSVESNEVDIAFSSRRLKRSPTPGPDDVVDITLDVGGLKVTRSLDLIATHDDVNLRIIDGDDFREHVGVKREWATYGSRDGDAAMLVKHHPEHGARLEGTLLHNDDTYFIQPADNSKRHVLHKINDDLKIGPPIDKFKKDAMLRRQKRDSRVFEVETMMVFDQLFYFKWKKVTGKGEDTVELMKEFYGLLINEMNIRFQTMKKDFNFDMRVVMGGLVIDVDGTKKPVHFTTTPLDNLSSFNRWVIKNFDDIDHVMIHTGGEFHKRVLGNAWLGGICGYASVGQIANSMDYRATYTSAHELGHNVNMAHDGDRRCPEQWIMWPISMQLVRHSDYPAHAWRFSPCSYRDVVTIIKKLDKNKNNCLLKRTSTNSLAKYGKTQPGSKMTYDQQCNHTRIGTSFCSTKQNEYAQKMICYGIMCKDPSIGRKADERCFEIYPLPGTICGNYKVCRNGKCVDDKKIGSPVKNEACMFGDQNGLVILERGVPKYKCKDTAAVQNSWCYKSGVEKVCCASCLKYLKNGVGRCKFGEMSISVWINGKTYNDCPSAAKASSGMCYDRASRCCITCPKLDKGIRGCSYGDNILESYLPIKIDDKKYFVCSEAVKVSPGVCYKHNKKCCESCKAVRNDKQSKCEYGDYPGQVVPDQNRAMQSCKDLIKLGRAWSCYAEGARKCCGTCKKYETTDSRCKYGDKKVRIDNKYQVCIDVIKSADDAWHCYRQGYSCCDTCKKYETKIPRCKYGDYGGKHRKLKNKSCKEAITKDTSGHCYDHSIKRKCCGTCAKFETNDYGRSCKYGDKLGLLRGKAVNCADATKANKKCKDYYFKLHCCGTCGKINKT